jgi:hypothetical protein
MGRFQNNPSIGWVHPKSTHAHPLAWGNNKDSPPTDPTQYYTQYQIPSSLLLLTSYSS